MCGILRYRNHQALVVDASLFLGKSVVTLKEGDESKQDSRLKFIAVSPYICHEVMDQMP